MWLVVRWPFGRTKEVELAASPVGSFATKSDVCIWFEFSFVLFSFLRDEAMSRVKADIRTAIHNFMFVSLFKPCLLLQLAKTFGYIVKMFFVPFATVY